MIFHLGNELPEPVSKTLDHESSDLTREETRILKDQIRKNTLLIDRHVMRLDLLVNQEGTPAGEPFVEKIRRRLQLLMDENDTFRSVLWKHYRHADILCGKDLKSEI